METHFGSGYQIKTSDKVNTSLQLKMESNLNKLVGTQVQQILKNVKKKNNETQKFLNELRKVLPPKKLNEFKLLSREFLSKHANMETEIPKIKAENKKINELLKKEQQKIASGLNLDFAKADKVRKKFFDIISRKSRYVDYGVNKNALSKNELKKYSIFAGSKKGGNFYSPSGDGNTGIIDLAVYYPPFNGSRYRWSFSYSGINFYIDESTNRVYDATTAITANQINVSLGISGNTDSTYFDCENVSQLLINHTMDKDGYIRVIGIIQCIFDTDFVEILDHSTVFTWRGNEHLGESETKNSHALYLDIGGQNIGKSIFYQSDAIQPDGNDRSYTNLDNIVESTIQTLGIAVPTKFNKGETIPLWLGTGTESHSTATGQEIRSNTYQSWRLQSVMVLTTDSFNP